MSFPYHSILKNCQGTSGPESCGRVNLFGLRTIEQVGKVPSATTSGSCAKSTCGSVIQRFVASAIPACGSRHERRGTKQN